MRCLRAAPGSATTRSLQGVRRRELLVQEVPGRERDELPGRDADRDRDALGRLEVEPDDVEREVRLDDLAGAATRHREDLADLERQPLLGLLGPREAVGRVLRLAELEAAEQARERRTAPGHAAASTSSKSRWKPSGVEGVAPARTASLRIVQRSLAASGSADFFFSAASAAPARTCRRGFWPARARPRRAPRSVSAFPEGVGERLLEDRFDEIEALLGEKALQRGAARQPSIPFLRSSDGGFGPSQSAKSASANSLPSMTPELLVAVRDRRALAGDVREGERLRLLHVRDQGVDLVDRGLLGGRLLLRVVLEALDEGVLELALRDVAQERHPHGLRLVRGEDRRGVLRGRLEVEAADVDLEDGLLAEADAVELERLVAHGQRVGHVDARELLGGRGAGRDGGGEGRGGKHDQGGAFHRSPPQRERRF